MSDIHRKLQDHFESLFLLDLGLKDANALLSFLMALGSTIQGLDEPGDCTNLRSRFLQGLDSRIEQIHQDLDSSPETVQAVQTFRQKLDQLIAEMDMYRRSPH